LNALDYGWFGVLGVTAGLIATLLPVAFYRARDAFRNLPLPPALNTALGGLGLGLIALKLRQVLGAATAGFRKR